MFKRGEKHRLAEIHRKKSSGAKRVVLAVQAGTSSNTGEDQVVISSISPPRDGALYATSDVEIVRENKRLREENARLKQELYKLKSMFRNVAGLMKALAGDEPVSAVRVEECLPGMEINLNRAWVGDPVDAALGSKGVLDV